MNGRRGLVPSNFLEPVHDNLLETKEKMMNSESPIARLLLHIIFFFSNNVYVENVTYIFLSKIR